MESFLQHFDGTEKKGQRKNHSKFVRKSLKNKTKRRNS